MPTLPGRAPTAVGMSWGARDFSEENACLGKIRYSEWRDAEGTVQRIIVENIEAGAPQKSSGLGVYTCPWCGAYHVGHSRGPREIISEHGNGFRIDKRRRKRERRTAAARPLEPASPTEDGK